MIQKFTSLLLAVGFVIVLSFNAIPVQNWMYLLLGFAAALTIVNWIFHHKKFATALDGTLLILPVLWVFAAASVVALSPNFYWRVLVILMGSLGLLILEVKLRPKAPIQFLDNQFFLSVIGLYLSIWAIDFYFTPGWWIIMILIFFSSAIFFWVGFYDTPVGFKIKATYSLLLAVVFMEIGWALLYWPLHYFATTLVLSSIFYLTWIIVRFQLSRLLTREKIIFHSVFSTTVLIMILIFTSWMP